MEGYCNRLAFKLFSIDSGRAGTEIGLLISHWCNHILHILGNSMHALLYTWSEYQALFAAPWPGIRIETISSSKLVRQCTMAHQEISIQVNLCLSICKAGARKIDARFPLLTLIRGVSICFNPLSNLPAEHD